MTIDNQHAADITGIPHVKYSTGWGDLPLAILQKLSFGLLDYRAAAVARAVQGMGSSPVTLYAHSQGTLLATNLMLRGALPSGSTVQMFGPASNWFSATVASAIGGYHLSYTAGYFDWVNVFNFPHPNVLYNLSGLVPVHGFGRHMEYPYAPN